MKKYAWIVALLLALSLAIFGCGGGDDDNGDDSDLPTVEITGADIVLKYCGSKGKAEHVDGNKFILVEQDDLSNVGFYYEFPEAVKGKGYGTVNIEMEVISIENPDFIGLMTFSSSSFSGAVNVLDKTTGEQKKGQYDHEFKLGVECEKGAAGDSAEGGDGILDGSSAAGVKHDESYPFGKFTDRIAFQVNRYAGNITGDWNQDTGKATFTIAVTKITFPGGKAVEPEVPEEAKAGTIFDLTEWLAAADALDADGNPKTPFVKAGTVTLSKTATSLVIVRDSNNWSGIDLSLGGLNLDFDKFNYAVTITGSSDQNSDIIKAGQKDDPYTELGRTSALTPAGTSGTFTKNLPDNFGSTIRVNSENETGATITITALKIEAVAKAP